MQARPTHPISQQMEARLHQKRLDQFDNREHDTLLPDTVAEDLAEFERQMAVQKMVTVHERLGYPVVVPMDRLAEEALPVAIAELIDLFVVNDICIDFFGEYTSTEIYAAIVDDILPQEIVELTASGWVSHICHSTPENELRFEVAAFVDAVLEKARRELLGPASPYRPVQTLSGHSLSAQELSRQLATLWSRLGTLFAAETVVQELELSAGTARATARVHWHTKSVGGCGAVTAEFVFQTDADGWQLVATDFIEQMLHYL